MLSSLRAIRPSSSRSLSPFRLARMASNTTYTPNEETEIQQWLTTASRLQQAGTGPDADPILDTLNSHLSTRTTLLGTKPSKADTALYSAVRPLVAAWSPEQRTGEKGYPNIVRHLDFVQNYPAFAADVKPDDKVAIDLDNVLYVKPPVDAKAEKERLKKEKAAAAAAGGDKAALPDRTKDASKDKSAGEKVKEAVVEAKDKVKAAVAGDAKPKKEKKEKAPKPQKAAAPAAPLSPALIDLRVGHILKAIKHPEADSLYVSTIAVGDEPNDDTTEYEGQVCRTVCSGLNGLVPLESMQGRKVVVVCNLKPVKMRGIKSCAMVLAASPRLKEGETDDHKGPVELVTPPADAKAGERVCFQGWEGEPEGVLNPKKKIWETFQPGFTTTDDLAVAFDAGVVEALGKQGVAKLVTKSGGLCTVPSLKDAVVR
ncbi:nucleic acid-binding protein [Colletotrichum sublineola]|nr:nucleic acid-binding protein [Colletotrichum sublineola]